MSRDRAGSRRDGRARGAAPGARADRPGSAGEHRRQAAHDSVERADTFYRDQVCDHLLPAMVEFADRMDMVFVSTAAADGSCDQELCTGGTRGGALVVLDERRLALPVEPGGRIAAHVGANPHIGLLMVDFVEELIGLHVNGRARVVDEAELRIAHPGVLGSASSGGSRGRHWVLVEVVEAYIHCRKHIPRMQLDAAPGAGEPTAERPRGGARRPRPGRDFFGAVSSRGTRRAGSRPRRARSGG